MYRTSHSPSGNHALLAGFPPQRRDTRHPSGNYALLAGFPPQRRDTCHPSGNHALLTGSPPTQRESRNSSGKPAPFTGFTQERLDSRNLSVNPASIAGFPLARVTISPKSPHHDATPHGNVNLHGDVTPHGHAIHYDDAIFHADTITYGYSNDPIDRYQIYRISFNIELYKDDPDDVLLGRYLTTLQRPDGMTDSQYQQLRKKSKNFFVRDGFLFKRPRHHGVPPRRVVGLKEEREKIMKEMHDENGHLGQKATYNFISKRYQWKGMYGDVVEWVKTCDECQKRAQRRFQEPLHPTWSITVWGKTGLDVVYMPWEGKDGFIVLARDDLSGWVEGRVLESTKAEGVAKFPQEEVFCRHGVPR
jgi:hypothetical protein